MSQDNIKQIEEVTKSLHESLEKMKDLTIAIVNAGDKMIQDLKDLKDEYLNKDEEESDDEYGEYAKCWYCNATGVDSKDEVGNWIHQDCVLDSDKEEDKSESETDE